MSCVQSTIRVADLNLNAITLSDPKTQGTPGSKVVFIGHKGEKLFMQLPAMPAPYGLSSWPNEKNPESEKMHLDLSMVGYDEQQGPVKEMFDMFVKLESLFVDKAVDNSTNWFKKKYTNVDTVRDLMHPIIKYSKDKETGELSHKYPPVIRLTIPKRNGKIETTVFNTQREEIPFESVNWKGATIGAIVEISAIWIINGKFSVSIKATQLKVTPSAKFGDTYAFLSDTDDEDEE